MLRVFLQFNRLAELQYIEKLKTKLTFEATKEKNINSK